MNKKALILFSGGLDSALAAKVMLDQGIDLVALHFYTPFFFESEAESKRTSSAELVAQDLGIPIKLIEKGEDFIDLVRHPKHGYGKNLNPCIDCRIYIFKKAGELIEPLGASFLVSGEVLGQRPMSQRRDTINLIDRESGLKGLILRPLSAKCFPETIPEQEGIVDRERLLGISGRGRKEQFELAERFGLKGYDSPGGGCLLTDRIYSHRLRDVFEHVSDFNMADLRQLRVGRHFRINDGLKVIMGRNQEDNRKLIDIMHEDNIIYRCLNKPGPVLLARGAVSVSDEQLIGAMLRRYAHVKPGESLRINRIQRENETPLETAGDISDDRREEMRI
jgi:tRNA-specific 2-thiouridylase